jgi:hypothetical protein
LPAANIAGGAFTNEFTTVHLLCQAEKQVRPVMILTVRWFFDSIFITGGYDVQEKG